MAQSWRHLLFAHWRVDPGVLARVVPPQLRLDLRDGGAWVGVTPFCVAGLRLRNALPIPLVSSFFEVNVRTYVRVGDKPGIYFFSLDAASRAAVAAARRSYRLPYFQTSGGLAERDGEFEASLERESGDGPPARLALRYRATGAELPMIDDSLERWLAERYCLYTLDDEQRVLRADIHHPPWPLQPASAELDIVEMTAGLGFELEGEPLLHFSDRQDVVLWTLESAGEA